MVPKYLSGNKQIGVISFSNRHWIDPLNHGFSWNVPQSREVCVCVWGGVIKFHLKIILCVLVKAILWNVCVILPQNTAASTG